MSESQRLALISVINQLHEFAALEAYKTCKASESKDGLFAWIEFGEGGHFVMRLKGRPHFNCRQTGVSGSETNLLCKNKANILVRLSGKGSDAMNFKEHCPGNVLRDDGSMSNAFDDLNERKVVEFSDSVSCRGKADGPLIITFQQGGGWFAPEPDVLIVP